MRIPKIILLNLVLGVLAILSWSLFFADSRSDSRPVSAHFFTSELPPDGAHYQLFIDTDEGNTIEAFPSIVGKSAGREEMRQIDMLMKFVMACHTARLTTQLPQLQRIGRARLTDDAGGPVLEFQVFRTDDGQFVFQSGDRFYRTEGDSLRDLIEYIRAKQAPPEA